MPDIFGQLLNNRVLICGLTAWLIAQFVKPFIDFPFSRQMNLGLWFSSGGMPSSHSSLMVATTLGIGLYHGFDHPAFAIAVAISMIVIYDAAGVRRQAGFHAQKINQILQMLFSGQPISEDQLKEVIGHSPREVSVGVLLGFVTATLIWAFWH